MIVLFYDSKRMRGGSILIKVKSVERGKIDVTPPRPGRKRTPKVSKQCTSYDDGLKRNGHEVFHHHYHLDLDYYYYELMGVVVELYFVDPQKNDEVLEMRLSKENNDVLEKKGMELGMR